MRRKPYKRTNKQDAKYYIDFYDFSSGTKKRVTRSTGTADYQTACSILKVKQSEAARAKFDVTSVAAQRLKLEQSRPLMEHVAEYLQQSDAGDHHLRVTTGSLMRFAQVSKRDYWKEITDEDGSKFLQHLRAEGLSAGTITNYRRTIKGFSRWMYESKRAPTDQLVSLKGKKNKQSRQRVIRRGVLTREQFGLLFKECRGHWRRTNPADRKLAYCLATRCGLRAAEIWQLTETSFCLHGSHPFVFLREDQTKNGKEAKLFLGKKLASQVEEYYASGNTLSNLPHKHTLYLMLRHDLKKAGLQCDLGNGERIDFHALRHTCGFWLMSEGVNIKTVQSIMRHSTIRLTLDTYGHLIKGAEEDAIEQTEHMLLI